jgi:transglutaminase-like putative cysteine protease
VTIAQETSRNLPSSTRVPWSLLIASLISFAALYITGDQFLGLPFLAALVIASGLVQWRLPRGALWAWMLRAVLFAVVFVNYRLPDRRDMGGWYVDPGVMKLAGYLLAAELTLRLWQLRRPERLARETLLLSACIMATAAVTYEPRGIHIVTPIYIVAIIVSTRAMAAMSTGKRPRATRFIRSLTLRSSALLVALAIGFAAVTVYDKLMYKLDAWAVSLINFKPGPSDSVGFSTAHELVGSYNPEPSMSRVLLIDGKIFEPHLRILAFDSYSNRVWRPYESDRTFRAFASRPSAGQSKIHIQRIESNAALLPVPLSAAAVSSEDPLEIEELASLRDLSENSSVYDVTEQKSPDFQGPICLAPSPEERERLLKIPPEIDPKVISLAREVAGAGDPLNRATRVETYLRTHHEYSLTYLPQGEPINDFILNNRAAHCQFFAAALVMMARAAGVPARYVGGFYAHESEGPDRTVVRERDAHAWAECWIDGTGWVTLDATPADGKPDQVYADPSTLRKDWEEIEDTWGRLTHWIADLFANFRVTMLVAAIVVPLILILIRGFRPRAVPAGLSYSDPGEKLTEISRRFEALLRRRGIACPPDRPWADCITSLPNRDSESHLITLYNQARFGGNVQALGDASSLLNLLENENISKDSTPNATTH